MTQSRDTLRRVPDHIIFELEATAITADSDSRLAKAGFW
jgi:hypothetical protein